MTEHAKLIHLRHQRLWLLPQKAIYWQEKNILFLADLHIGKSGHFRKQGIPVPGEVNTANLDSITHLIQTTTPGHLVILGDLFHSEVNKEWGQFNDWRKTHSDLEVSLVIGNHDILSYDLYRSSRINLSKYLIIDPFLLIHDPHDIPGIRNQDNYILSGHVHPAVKLKGRGRQTIKLSCFYFGKNRGILPAFGTFTGTHVISPKPGEQIFAVAEDQVIKIRQPTS